MVETFRIAYLSSRLCYHAPQLVIAVHIWGEHVSLKIQGEPDVPNEAERRRDYDPRHFYPVMLGDIFHDKYEVVVKVGFGRRRAEDALRSRPPKIIPEVRHESISQMAQFVTIAA